MSSSEFVLFAVQVALLLGCALASGEAMRRLGQPAVLGEMIGGILLGPTLFGALAPRAYAWLLSDSGNVGVVREGAIKLGMLMFLFIAGLDIDLQHLRKHGVAALLIGLLGSLVPLGVGAALVYAVPGMWGPLVESHRLAFALLIGVALANSANPVLARILMDLRLLNTPIGAVIMSATVVDDLVAWALLAVILADVAPAQEAAYAGLSQHLAWVAVFCVALLVVGRWLAAPLLGRLRRVAAWPSGFIGAVLVAVLAASAAAEQLGIHAFLGAFLLGIALSPTEEERGAYEVITHFALSFFAPIYFVSMGLRANFVTHFDPVQVLVVLVAATASKLGSVYAASRLAGLSARWSLAIGCGMNARGATGIILAALALDKHVIDEPVYVALVVMALATSLAAGPSMHAALGNDAPRRRAPAENSP